MEGGSPISRTPELVNIVARQVAQQIENLRLLESAERYRYEAEQAARLQTRENWQAYFQSERDNTISYLYDLNEVRPSNPGYETNEDTYTLPLKVRDEAIGKLAIQGLASDDHESIDLINAVADRLTAHIEGLRQNNQTESALAQSEKLFDASRNLTLATDLQQLVNTAVSTLNIPEINRAILVSFNYNESDNVESLDVIANWWNGTGQQATTIGTHYPVEVIRVMQMFISPTPVFFDDTFTDERVDATTMQLVQRLILRAVAVLPLHIGAGQMGALILEAEVPHHFTSEEIRLFTAIAPQIATIMDNHRQFQETKRGQVELDKRARQLAAVAEVSSVSSKELDIQKMLESVVLLTQRKFRLYHAHVFLYNEKADELKIAACGWQEGDVHEGTHETAAIPMSQEQSLVARAARTQQPVIANNVRNEPGWLPNPLLPDTGSELAVPLLMGDHVLGVLDVQSDELNAFSEEDANIQTTLASQVSTALQNARSFTRAQKQAERETMLNVINQKIQSATSVEAVLQIAARELGHALGAPMTIAQISMKDKSS
jgi:GAF domain-containing protein